MMSEQVTFPNFRIDTDSIEAIGAITLADGKVRSVADELRIAFDYQGDNYGELIGAVAPHRELQLNIEHAKERLADPKVQKDLGYEDRSPISIARSWVERAGLMLPVDRPFQGPSDKKPDHYDIGLIPERVPNWLWRMADLAISHGGRTKVSRLALVSSERKIGPNEKPEVAEGTRAESYMEKEILPHLQNGRTRTEIETGQTDPQDIFETVEILKTGEKTGDEAMARAAKMLVESGVVLQTSTVVVYSVAGNSIQSGAQALKGIRSIYPKFNIDPDAPQLYIVGDGFPLGETGEEPKETHQNPFSALGNIPRGFKLINDLVKLEI